MNSDQEKILKESIKQAIQVVKKKKNGGKMNKKAKKFLPKPPGNLAAFVTFSFAAPSH